MYVAGSINTQNEIYNVSEADNIEKPNLDIDSLVLMAARFMILKTVSFAHNIVRYLHVNMQKKKVFTTCHSYKEAKKKKMKG